MDSTAAGAPTSWSLCEIHSFHAFPLLHRRCVQRSLTACGPRGSAALLLDPDGFLVSALCSTLGSAARARHPRLSAHESLCSAKCH